MSWFEYPLVALACALCGAIGFFAGAVLVIKAFVDMHNIGLPPAMRPTSIFSKHNLTVGTTCALLYVMAAVILAGIVSGGWFAFAIGDTIGYQERRFLTDGTRKVIA